MLMIGPGICAAIFTANPLHMAPAHAQAAPNPDPIAKDLATLEHRFFFHPYASDSTAKRLERLELMTLGAVQEDGTDDVRLKKLKEMIAIKDRESAKNIAREKDPSPSSGNKTNYPVLGKLETQVLKKTYVGESIDQRLDRLEKQVFGMPAEAMSYIDRIERLKKTTGLDAPVVANIAPGPGGAVRNNAPDSRIWSVPHSMRTYPNADKLNSTLPPGATFKRFTNPDGSSGFVYQYRNDGKSPRLPSLPQGPDMSLVPRLDDFDSGLGAYGGIGGGALNKVFDRMNRQMEQMLRNVPDDIAKDLLDDDEPPTARPTAPLRKTPTKIQNLPPYLDPNSI